MTSAEERTDDGDFKDIERCCSQGADSSQARPRSCLPGGGDDLYLKVPAVHMPPAARCCDSLLGSEHSGPRQVSPETDGFYDWLDVYSDGTSHGPSEPATLWQSLDYIFTDPFGTQPPARASLKHHNLSAAAKAWAAATFTAAVSSTILLVVESFPESYRSRGDHPWASVDTAFCFFFLAETAARFTVAREKKAFFRHPLNLADVLSIVPFFIGLAASLRVSFSLRVFRMFRAVWILRAARLSAGLEANATLISRALVKSNEVLTLYLCVLVISVVVWSAAVYFVERSQGTVWDPDLELLIRRRKATAIEGGRGESVDSFVSEVSPFQSVVHAFWWCITTLTTVGYGDVVPNSVGGKIVAGLTMLVGIFVLALPASIVGSNFLCVYEMMRATGDASEANEDAADAETQSVMTGLLSFTEELLDARTMAPHMGEFLRRSCWNAAYRARILWAYKAILLHEQDNFCTMMSQYKFVGLLGKDGVIECPEMIRILAPVSLRAELPEGALIVFTVCVCPSEWLEGVPAFVRTAEEVPEGLSYRAREGIREGSFSLWSRLFEDEPGLEEEAALQSAIAEHVDKVQDERARIFLKIIESVLPYITERCAAADAEPLSNLYRTDKTHLASFRSYRPDKPNRPRTPCALPITPATISPTTGYRRRTFADSPRTSCSTPKPSPTFRPAAAPGHPLFPDAGGQSVVDLASISMPLRRQSGGSCSLSSVSPGSAASKPGSMRRSLPEIMFNAPDNVPSNGPTTAPYG
ncbi:Potassium voltage-gated channel protein Shab [Diplonema papillatum]|nr:Potassium voltage-gated channel protein Shab [Diplonema papillatum]